jgi:hypothetical protein
MWEAWCPPRGAPLSARIERRPLAADPARVMAAVAAQRDALGVSQSLIVSFGHGAAAGALALYLTPAAVDAPAVMAALAAQLHAYELPLDILTLSRIPADHAQLPPPSLRRGWDRGGRGAGAAGGDDGAPRTDSERAVLAVWKEALGAAAGAICPPPAYPSAARAPDASPSRVPTRACRRAGGAASG